MLVLVSCNKHVVANDIETMDVDEGSWDVENV